MEIMYRHQKVVDVSLVLFSSSWVSECTLVVRYRPFRGTHHTQVVVAVSYNAAQKSVLGRERLLRYYKEKVTKGEKGRNF